MVGEDFPEKRHYSEDRRKRRNEQGGTRLSLGALEGWGGYQSQGSRDFGTTEGF